MKKTHINNKALDNFDMTWGVNKFRDHKSNARNMSWNMRILMCARLIMLRMLTLLRVVHSVFERVYPNEFSSLSFLGTNDQVCFFVME